MPLTEGIFIAAFLVLELVLIVLCFCHGINQGIWEKHRGRVGAFSVIQFLLALLILCGGYLEKEFKLYSSLRRPIDERIYAAAESPDMGADPALVRWVEEQRPILSRPDFENVENFLSWQASLRRKLLDIFGMSEINSSANVKYQTMSSANVRDGVTRTFLTFVSFDGTSVPCYLLQTAGEGKRPGILVLPGHVGEYEEGITETAGLKESYQHKAALELAKAGFIVLTMEFRGFGYLGRRVDTEHKLVAHNAILGGSFYKAIISRDIGFAVNLLESLPEVDSERIGLTGVSYGGEMAVTYAALDQRIKGTAFQGFGGELGPEKAASGRDTEQPHYCHTIPGQNNILLREDLYYLIAPRPLLGIMGDRDYSGDRLGFSDVVGKAYEVFKKPSSFGFVVVPGGHEYFVQPAVEFFREYL